MKMLFSSLSIFFFLMLPLNLSAEADKENFSDLPNSGLLAGSGTIHYGNLTIPQVFEGPIQGSVSLALPRECSFQVNNSASSSSFSVSVELREFNSSGRIGSSSFSYTLRPGQTEGRTVRVRNNTAGCALWLSSWREVKKR